MRRLRVLAFSILALIAAPIGVTRGAVAATPPLSTVILSGDAVGSVHFGEKQSAAAASLVELIGKSEGGLRKENQGDCIISSALYWSNFAAYFYHGKFDGYQTMTSGPGRAFIGVTPQGLRVGFTLAQAERLYGAAFSTNGAQDGVYSALTKTGTIRGFLSMEPNQAPATTVKLLTISAGSVGCPAMSPQ